MCCVLTLAPPGGNPEVGTLVALSSHIIITIATIAIIAIDNPWGGRSVILNSPIQQASASSLLSASSIQVIPGDSHADDGFAVQECADTQGTLFSHRHHRQSLSTSSIRAIPGYLHLGDDVSSLCFFTCLLPSNANSAFTTPAPILQLASSLDRQSSIHYSCANSSLAFVIRPPTLHSTLGVSVAERKRSSSSFLRLLQPLSSVHLFNSLLQSPSSHSSVTTPPSFALVTFAPILTDITRLLQSVANPAIQHSSATPAFTTCLPLLQSALEFSHR
ncbi:hypothetical protein QBC38DRAFT_456273 [Podospora fimiseda]|uniref:Uncharacterized protein n=1 Tax=Podospora fimiseda TaxID=252190 RepID=A0AAN7GX13_9PEZI|nr:hypothetical protein QBC38DRAFT_456273 [Podospora fimiseda]